MKAFEDLCIDPTFYSSGEVTKSEVLPWDIIDTGDKNIFWEYEKALKESKPMTAESAVLLVESIDM